MQSKYQRQDIAEGYADPIKRMKYERYRDRGRPLCWSGQLQTEERLIVTKLYEPIGGRGEWTLRPKGSVGDTNPLVAHFANDPEIGRLRVDENTLKFLADAPQIFPLCLCCPPLWALSIVFMQPCTWLHHRQKLSQAAAAHQLTLHEKSLKLKVDPYPKYLRDVTKMNETPWCCACCCNTDTLPIEEVVPLVDVKSVHIERHKPKDLESCYDITVETFVVRVNGVSDPMFAVDAPDPEQAETFIRQILDQVAIAKETVTSGAPLPAEWSNYKMNLYDVGGESDDDVAPRQMEMTRVTGVQPMIDDKVAQLAMIDGLKKRDVITEEEYVAMRKKALGLSADSDSDLETS